MKKTNILDELKDDELLREQAMGDGAKNVLTLTFRPVTALSVSWMQRNNIFDESKDIIWRSAAFAYLHTEPKENIRGVVNNKQSFDECVDIWIEENMTSHLQVSELARFMNEEFTKYTASISEAKGSFSKPTGKHNNTGKR